MRNSFTNKYAQLWNKLPEDVKLADNILMFLSLSQDQFGCNFYIFKFFFVCVVFITFYIRVYID